MIGINSAFNIIAIAKLNYSGRKIMDFNWGLHNAVQDAFIVPAGFELLKNEVPRGDNPCAICVFNMSTEITIQKMCADNEDILSSRFGFLRCMLEEGANDDDPVTHHYFSIAEVSA